MKMRMISQRCVVFRSDHDLPMPSIVVMFMVIIAMVLAAETGFLFLLLFRNDTIFAVGMASIDPRACKSSLSHAIGTSGNFDPTILQCRLHKIFVLVTICWRQEIIVILMI